MKLVRGIISGIIGVFITWLVSFIRPMPWTIGQAFIAVGVASFFAAGRCSRTRPGRIAQSVYVPPGRTRLVFRLRCSRSKGSTAS
ncbi:MAG: hypothetical protein ACLFUA_07125 [Spirochaetales bacterium]